MLRKMAKRLSALVLGCSLAASNPLAAQTSGYVSPDTVGVHGPATSTFTQPDDCIPGVWINADYLIWWLKAAPAPGPILTTGPVTDATPGFLGQPNTRVVYGNETISNNAFSGLRLEAGTWIDEPRTIGYEASLFTLEHRSTADNIYSNAAGSPVLVRPYTNAITNQPSGQILAFPGVLQGGATITNSTRMSSWDANALFNIRDDGDIRGDVLVGMRGLFLYEQMTVGDSVTALVDLNPANANALRAGERVGSFDNFNTKNNFYGGQIGGRLSRTTSLFTFTATAKLALGVTDQLTVINGQTTTRTQGNNIPAGLFANDGTFGRYYNGAFAFIPELDLSIGYRIHPNITLRAGYSALYWSSVARPGNVSATVVNPNLVPSLTSFGGANTTQPRPTVGDTDFWATGINLGAEFRF